MKIVLSNMVRNSLAEIKTKRWKEMDPGWGLQVMNDSIKMFLDAKPEELADLQSDLREFFCVEKEPLMGYGTVSRGK